MTDAEILTVQGWAKRHVFEVYWERQVGNKGEGWLNRVKNSFAIFHDILKDHYRNSPNLPTAG
jgi:hypothetical protein